MKARYVNELIRRARISSVIDWGCGDGGQLALLDLDGIEYLGFDVSAEALALCVKRHPTLDFSLFVPGSEPEWYAGDPLAAELGLSMDVIFHLVDDDVFDEYFWNLFQTSTRFVLIHGTDYEAPAHRHVRRRAWTHLVDPKEWTLLQRPDDPEVNGFYLYGRTP